MRKATKSSEALAAEVAASTALLARLKLEKQKLSDVTNA
jgi:hypothetical protein